MIFYNFLVYSTDVSPDGDFDNQKDDRNRPLGNIQTYRFVHFMIFVLPIFFLLLMTLCMKSCMLF